MYYLYDKMPLDGGFQFKLREKTQLFGCNNGWIPYFAKRNLTESSREPFLWRSNVRSIFAEDGDPSATLLVDLKPNSASPSLSLYELIEVWGYSNRGWTPIMLRLRGLFVDQDPNQSERRDFTRTGEQIQDPIFSLMYLQGSVEGKRLRGRWTAPGRSSTNSVLLWPETLKYFMSEASKVISQKA
jgi:hypothetical protein